MPNVVMDVDIDDGIEYRLILLLHLDLEGAAGAAPVKH